MINRLVVYVPTYSKLEYGNYDILSNVMVLLFLMFAMDTKLSQKVNTLSIGSALLGVKESFTNEPNTSKEVQQQGTKTVMNGPTQSLQVDGIHDSGTRGNNPTKDSAVNQETFIQPPMTFEPVAINETFGASLF